MHIVSIELIKVGNYPDQHRRSYRIDKKIDRSSKFVITDMYGDYGVACKVYP